MHKKSVIFVQVNDWVYDKRKWCMGFALTLVRFFVILPQLRKYVLGKQLGGLVMWVEN